MTMLYGLLYADVEHAVFVDVTEPMRTAQLICIANELEIVRGRAREVILMWMETAPLGRIATIPPRETGEDIQFVDGLLAGIRSGSLEFSDFPKFEYVVALSLPARAVRMQRGVSNDADAYWRRWLKIVACAFEGAR